MSDSASRAAYKRAWEREHDHGTCATCGGRTGRKRNSGCRACAQRLVIDARQAKDTIAETMWERGYATAEIAAVLGTTINSVGTRINRLRKEGRAPYRHTYPRGSA